MHIYHALTWGPLTREIVSAATGKDIRDVLADEILNPLGFRWTNYGVAPQDVPLVAPSHATGKPLPAPIAAAFKLAVGGTTQQIIPFTNTPQFLTSVVPSSSTVSTANELSRFAEMLASRRRTRRGADHEARDPARRDHAGPAAAPGHRDGADAVALGHRIHVGLQAIRAVRSNAPAAFGHTGLVDIAIWADPERDLAVGVVSSGKPGGHPEAKRYPAVLDAIAAGFPAHDRGIA